MYPKDTFIAFLSDFGLKDPYVGTVKGVIATINPSAKVIDITHGIPAQDITAAALMLEGACGYFPKGTIFLAVVDPGVGSDRRGIVLTLDSYIFVVPDNGLVTRLLKDRRLSDISCHYIEKKEYFLSEISSTFHARDIFAPVAAHLSLGTAPEELGPSCHNPVVLDWPEPVTGHDVIRGAIIYIDTFGNLVTNIPSSYLIQGKGMGPTARYARIAGNDKIIIPIARTYSDVEPGRPLCLAGSFGLVEIAVNQGSASEQLRAETGDMVELGLK